jgi:hypothetical protein
VDLQDLHISAAARQTLPIRINLAIEVLSASGVVEDTGNAICHTVCNTSKEEADGDPNRPFQLASISLSR